MNIEQLNAIIGGLALSYSPEARAAAARVVNREQFVLQARMIGIPEETIVRMREIAETTGPMTVLSNTDVWRAVWQSMIRRASRGESPIPDDTDLVRWARAVWQEIHCGDPDIREYAAFMSLLDALKYARSQYP